MLLGPDGGASPGRGHLGGQIGHVDGEAVAGGVGPLDDIVQLPDVARPLIAGKAALDLRGEDRGTLKLQVELGQEVVGQLQNVPPAGPQGRHLDVDDIEPVVEVLPKVPGLDELRQVPAGGRDDPHVHRHRAGAPHRLHLPLLEGPEDLGLHIQGHVADLIQKEGAAVGQLELARLAPLLGSGKGPILIAEEL